MNKQQIRQALVSLGLTLLVLLIGAIVYQRFSSQKKSTLSSDTVREEIRNVNIGTFAPGPISTTITLDGRINAYEKIELGAEVTGKLVSTARNLKKGDFFKKGELLFQIYDQDDRYSLYAQRATLLNSISQMMPDLKFDYPNSFDKWKLYLDNYDVEQNVKELPQVTDLNEKYYIAGKNIETQYFTIKSLEDRLTNYKIYAPFSGSILSISAYPGTLVRPGSPLATIMNTAKYELEAPISIDDLAYVKPGQKVNLYTEDTNQSWSGVVSRTSKQIDQATQNVPVFISVFGRGLRDGMYLNGELKGNQIEDVVALPTSIIVDQNKVFVLADSLLQKKHIQIVNRDEKTVLAKGISPNDQVVISGVNNIFEGQKAQALN